MKKAICISAATIGVIILLVGSFIYIKLNPPLVGGNVGTGDENHIVLVGVGNKGFKDIKITEVLINQNKQPQKLKVQVSNSLKGFMIGDPFDARAQEYGATDLESVTIQPKTSPQLQLDKVNNGTATEKDVIYGITIAQDQPIQTVIIKYRYLGLSFVKTISIRDF
ncbi:hypothetical protein [Bacillus salipaludis]|uniref:DUF4330 domain-containing protein n=1 Tax=Bacillus salipaludis TaxID=2547811 RepID=A0ABW8RHD4_9BACI